MNTKKSNLFKKTPMQCLWKNHKEFSQRMHVCNNGVNNFNENTPVEIHFNEDSSNNN